MADTYKTFAFAKQSVEEGFQQITIERSLPGDDDVQFDIVYCGVCHSDVHVGFNQLYHTKWPFVGGHELGKGLLKFTVPLEI